MPAHYRDNQRRTRRLFRVAGCLMVVIMVLVSFPVSSATADSHEPVVLYVNAVAASSGTGDSWEQAFSDLQEALAQTLFISGPIQIWVARGTYRPHESERTASFHLRPNVAIFGGFAGTETNLNQRDWRVNRTTLSGNLGQRASSDDNSFTVVTARNTDETAILDGFIVTGGNSDNNESAFVEHSSGGGLMLDNSHATIANLTVSGNRAVGSGGGMLVTSFSEPTITNVHVSGNQASVGGGIAIGFAGGTLTNILVSGNNAISRGGGIGLSMSTARIINTTVTGNAAGLTGGGVSQINSAQTFDNQIVWNNSAPEGPELHVFAGVNPGVNHAIIGGGCSVGAIQCLDVDPMFVDPLDPAEAPSNGGNYRLMPGSPAINAGNNVRLPGGLMHDLDGNPRIVDDVVDLGAYEWSPDPPETPPVDEPDFSPLDDIDNPYFWRTWARTDLPVRDGYVSRTWMWGPGPFTESRWEPYLESAGEIREVTYFDKTRMEINHPSADSDSIWYVTNGLLVVEMITGNRQFGDDLFMNYGSAQVHVAGDPDDPDSPTYASFANHLDAPAQQVGTLLTRRIDREGNVSTDSSLEGYQVTIAHVDTVTSHGIAGPFWAFMNSSGPVYENGAIVEDVLFVNPYYATGRPIIEPYWATVRVRGEHQDVLIQCFERRCLTYTPGNPPGFIVEAGNVGQHYFTWRYVLVPD